MNILQRATGSQSNTASTMTLTPTLAITGASSLVLFINSYKQITGVTDSKGNAWAKGFEGANLSGSGYVSAWLATGAVAGSTTITMTQSGTGTRPFIVACLEVDTALTFYAGGSASAISNAPSISLPNLPASVEFLVLAGMNVNAPTMTLTPPANWTLEISKPSALTLLCGQIVSRVVTISSPLTATFGMGSTAPWGAGMAAFIATATVPAPPAAGGVGTPPVWVPIPIPGYPLAEEMIERYFDSPPAITPPQDPVLTIPAVPSPGDDEARLEDAVRKSVEVLNDLMRSAAIFLDSLGRFAIRGRGLSDTRDPTSADNFTLGVGPCTLWVNRNDPTNPKLWFCTNPGTDSSTTATWYQIRLKGTGAAGVTGAF